MSDNPTTPDLTLRLFGVPRPPAEKPRVVTAGRLSFTQDGLSLRWISYDGVELLRSIAFVVRDADWGTYAPAVHVKVRDERDGIIRLLLSANIDSGTARLSCRISVGAMGIEAIGTFLTATAEATAIGDFVTNRTGFVVLHPARCAGQPVKIDHVDGKITDGTFPQLISPHQPFMAMQTITHQPAAGITVQTRFEGDVFEMEDQRNWSDASFKTYSRPLSLPFPYTIPNGETVPQSVDVKIIADQLPGVTGNRHGAVRLRLLGQPAGRLPILALGGQPRDYCGSQAAQGRLAALRLPLLLAELDAPGIGSDDTSALRTVRAITGADLALLLRRNAGELDALAASGLKPSALALVGADTDLIRECRRIFPAARIGTGTDAFFTEFNRNPPVAADFIFWTVNPTVHADDDASVMETPSVLADQVATARALCPGTELWCGPVTLRMRFNPNATGPATPPAAGQPPPDVDARQRGLFGAAFTLAQIAAWASSGISTLSMHAPFGPRGIIHTAAGFPVPWYDDQPDGAVYPVYHVLAGLVPYCGTELRSVENPDPGSVAALAVHDVLWLANLRPEPVTATVSGKRVRTLDADSFVEAVRQPDGFWDRDAMQIADDMIRLGPYAVARVR